jgi:hypothetical protein
MPAFPYTWFNLADSAIGELSATVDATQTSFAVKAGHGIKFPASDFVFKIEDEDIHCATRSTDTFSSLTRGYGGSTAAAHSVNSSVFLTGGRSLFQRIYDNLIGHTHPKADIPDFSHNHAQGDITNLVGDLAGKEAAGTAAAAVAAHAAAADPHAGYQLESEKGAANGYASLDAGGKVPSAQLPAAGSDPWTYVVLGSDFISSNATAVNVTGLNFTPAANTRYEIQGMFLLRTATATVGPRPGVAWPTGMTDGVAMLDLTSAAGTRVVQNGNVNAAVLAPVGGLPNTTQSWPCWLSAMILAGASPGSTFRVQLATETAATNVTMKAGSWIRYRTF